MAIRDHFRFSTRKPSLVTRDDSSASTGHDSNSSNKSNKSSNRLKLAKSFSWKTRSDSSSNSSTTDDSGEKMVNTADRPEKGVPSWLKKKNQPKKDSKKKGGKEDPREKPLTLENIQHQEMLSAFTWTFGNRGSFDGRSINGISPGTSRLPSFDAGSRPMPPGSGAEDEDPQPYYMRHSTHQPSLLSPESAAWGRRAAVHCAD